MSQTVGQALRRVRETLWASKIEAASVEARWLLEDVLDVDHAGLIAAAADTLDGRQLAQLDSFLEQRLAGRPIGRVLGWSEFYGRRFDVSDETLDPRADTETLIECVGDLFDRDAGLTFADIGTGTGAIGITLACEFPRATGVLTDISEGALEQARGNAKRHAVLDRITLAAGDMCAPLIDVEWSDLDLIVSNPPYIRSAEIAALDVSVRDHDPRLALDGGSDGLDAYRRLIADSPNHLKSGGWLVLEIGFDQSHSVQSLIEASLFLEFWEIRSDLGGNPRIAAAKRA
ncbi:MAG: peptide chain release factor N(5)-glutamine methyltransferase [Pseudomonadota bacterium]